jgi:hypothetical protein
MTYKSNKVVAGLVPHVRQAYGGRAERSLQLQQLLQ